MNNRPLQLLLSAVAITLICPITILGVAAAGNEPASEAPDVITGSVSRDSGTAATNEASGLDTAVAEPTKGGNAIGSDSRGNISFSRQIAPVLFDHCAACHGDRDEQSEYSVSTYERLMEAGSSGADPIVPGSIDESYLFGLVSADDPELWMPHGKPRLSDNEIQLLRLWIEGGAKFDGKELTTPLWQLFPPVTYSSSRESSQLIPVTAVAFSADGEQLAIGGLHEIIIIDPPSGQVIRRIHNVAERTYGLVFCPVSGELVAASGNPGGLGEVRVFDTATGEMVRELDRCRDAVFCVAFDPKGNRLACCGADHTIRIYDFASGKEVLVAQHHSDWVYRVAFSADGDRIISASRDMTAKVIDANTGDLVTTYNGHLAPVRDAAFLPGGTQAVSCGDDNKIHIWTTAGTGRASAMSETPQDEKKVAEIAGFGHGVVQLAVAADSVFGASVDARVHQFVSATRQHQHVFTADQYPVYAIAVHHPSRRLATGNHTGQVRIWNIDTGEMLCEWPR
jgi:WD40 repeat protein